MEITSDQVIIEGDSQLHGSVRAVPSKSHTHRAVIAASISEGTSKIENPSFSEDVRATADAVGSYGTDIKVAENSLLVRGVDHISVPENAVDCGESGSTIRFIVPILAHAKGISVVTGGPSLRKRPMQPLIDLLQQLGIQCYSVQSNGCAPLVLMGGSFQGGKARVVGNVSSQFISGLLFSAPLATQPTTIELSAPLESAPYVKMTMNVLACHGIHTEEKNNMSQFLIPGGQSPTSYNHVIEGDYSSAAFILVAGAITGSEIGVSGLNASQSLQGDSIIMPILKTMGVDTQSENQAIWVRSSHPTAAQIDARDCPDLVPPLAVLACFAQGTTRITRAERLRLKESDRLATVSSELQKMGAKIRATRDGLEITGVPNLVGAKVSSHGDHRIAMACAVAALRAKGDTVVDGARCVTKSYPTFFRDVRSLGGSIIGWK